MRRMLNIVHDGAKKLLLEEVTPEPEAAPAAPENPRHPKKKKAGPALRCIGVRGTSGREYRADAVLVATGGVSYPTTGSTGDGYKLAQQAGHTLIEPVPSLVSLVSHDADCKKMMGSGAEKRHPDPVRGQTRPFLTSRAKCCSLILASAAR